MWCLATGRTLGALSALATNQGSFFDRLGSSRSGATTTTLEKFARVLVDPANWPDSDVPQDVIRFAHAVGVSAPAASASADDAGAGIGHQASIPGDGEAATADPAAPSGRTPGAAEEGAGTAPLSERPAPASAAPGDLFAADALRGAA